VAEASLWAKTEEKKPWLAMPAAPQGLAASSASSSPSLICLDLSQAQTQTAALKNKLALLYLDQSATRDPEGNH